jgi:hypothetical protein
MTPSRRARDQAEAYRAKNGGIGVFTDAEADPVLIGIATDVAALVIAVPRKEYDGLELAKLLGFRDGVTLGYHLPQSYPVQATAMEKIECQPTTTKSTRMRRSGSGTSLRPGTSRRAT